MAPDLPASPAGPTGSRSRAVGAGRDAGSALLRPPPYRGQDHLRQKRRCQ